MAHATKSVVRFHSFAFVRWGFLWTEELIALLLVAFIFVTPASASTRLQERGLFMRDNTPGVVTDYTVAFKYATPQAIGSIDMIFCVDPIPYMPCEVPPGLDVSNATLANQLGEMGYSIQTKTVNHLVLTRTPQMIIEGQNSSYTFSNVKNPTDTSKAFSIRLRTHASTSATGPQVDFGSVRGQVQNGIQLETQVPPMLLFCVAEEVGSDCTETNNNYYTDMGNLSDKHTLMASSQMAAGTNASGGFAITTYGTALAAGTNVIDPLSVPTASRLGSNQFGINLVQNDELNIGANPTTGQWLNASPTAGYGTPNLYTYRQGDVIAVSTSVNLMQKFTVSYIVNASPQLKAGVYTTTITYVASGRF